MTAEDDAVAEEDAVAVSAAPLDDAAAASLDEAASALDDGAPAARPQRLEGHDRAEPAQILIAAVANVAQHVRLHLSPEGGGGGGVLVSSSMSAKAPD